METALKIVATGLCAVMVSIILKRTKPEYALLVSIVFAVVACILALNYFSEIIKTISNLFNKTGLETMYWEVLLKSVGIAFITQIGSNICEDAGEKAIGNKIELIGQIIILLYAVPVITGIFDLLSSLMESL